MHSSVLSQEVCDIFLTLESPKTLLDGTFGRGGHTRMMHDAFPGADVWAFDQDPEAIAWGRAQDVFHGVKLVQGCFSDFEAYISEKLSGILLDLGVSSPQLDVPERGFSFRDEGPLDMRMSQDGPTALDLIRSLSERALNDILWNYGQERRARSFAKIMKEHASRLQTTTDLAQLICRASGPSGREMRIHPATRVFQALRIAVNREIDVLTKTLPRMIDALEPGGVLVVISFHSLEDGAVKRAMKSACRQTYQCTKKPILPGEEEIHRNPRARSGKMRWIQRNRGAV